MSVIKKFTKGSKGVPGSEKCRVTFKLSKRLACANRAQRVKVAGTFNDWGKDIQSINYFMKLLKDGSFSLTVTLPINQEYLFKYVITNETGEVWVIDDDEATETRYTDFENSYISTKI